MTEKKGWGSTVLGWFIVQEGQAQRGSASGQAIDENPENLIEHDLQTGAPETLGGTPDIAATDFFQTPPPPATGGQIDFEAVFDAAGVDAEERGRVSKAVELLRSLPAGTDATVKKQIVEASLRAFGVPVEKIIEAGAEEIQALEFYIRNGATDTEKLIGESEQRIHEYEEEIKNIRMIMQERVREQQAVIQLCNDKKLEVQQILEFFGQDRVAAVVKASAKLHDPSGSLEETSAK